MAKETILVRARLVSASPDRTQYKPYAPGLEFDDLYVEIPVPSENADVEKGGTIVLDVDGMAILLDVVATAIEKMNNRWIESKREPHKNYNPLF